MIGVTARILSFCSKIPTASLKTSGIESLKQAEQVWVQEKERVLEDLFTKVDLKRLNIHKEELDYSCRKSRREVG